MALHVTVHASIAEIRCAEWARLFPGEVEGWQYYRAIEAAEIPGFEWLYFVIEEDGQAIAAVPAFLALFRLDTTVQGVLRRATDKLAQWFPRLVAIPMICLGSPVTEVCHIGFAPDVSEPAKIRLLTLLVGELMRYARSRKIGLLGVKDVTGDGIALWQACLQDFQQLPGLPTGMLDLPYNRFEDYLGSLSRATRKDMKRKLRAAASIRIERRVSIDDLLPRIVALYHETFDRSELQMERLPAAYFTQLLGSMRGQASCVLYWHDERLVAVNLILEDQTRLIDKFIGMDYEFVRSYSLYFVSWLANVRYCIERGISVYQAGQGCYAPKLRLGCRLQPNWYFFRHRNPIVNIMLKTLSRFVRVDRFDDDLRTVYGTLK